MRRWAIAGLFVFVACLVHRPSDAYKCVAPSDCEGGRVCQDGFCIVQDCPEDCTVCDEAARTCVMECTDTASCGTVTCPPDWTCTINCTGDDACQDITCFSSSTCRVTCTGFDACETLDCNAACQCDLTCSEAGACNAPSCPSFGNGTNRVECTSDGLVGSTCDSAHAAGCTKC